MKRIKEYIRKSKKMRETGFFVSGQNRGFLSAVVNANRCKSRLNGRSRSDNKIVCKLYREYSGFVGIKNQRKSKKIEASLFVNS